MSLCCERNTVFNKTTQNEREIRETERRPDMINEPAAVYNRDPFTPIAEEKGKSFQEAAKEYNGVSVSDFTNELHRQIDELFDKDA